eukprot:2695070-Amphidinium_carterae.1
MKQNLRNAATNSWFVASFAGTLVPDAALWTQAQTSGTPPLARACHTLTRLAHWYTSLTAFHVFEN